MSTSCFSFSLSSYLVGFCCTTGYFRQQFHRLVAALRVDIDHGHLAAPTGQFEANFATQTTAASSHLKNVRPISIRIQMVLYIGIVMCMCVYIVPIILVQINWLYLQTMKNLDMCISLFLLCTLAAYKQCQSLVKNLSVYSEDLIKRTAHNGQLTLIKDFTENTYYIRKLNFCELSLV